MAKARRTPRERQAADDVATAVTLHRAGNLDEARAIYRRVLEVEPDHPDALHFLGVLCHQLGKGAEAVDLIRRSIAVCPGYPDAHNNLGNVLKEQGDLDGAAASYRRVIELRSDHPDAYNNLGTVFHAQGKPADAITCYDQAIAREADHADAHLNRGNALKKLGKIDAAIDAYLKTISLRRYHWVAYRNLGSSLYFTGRIEEAADVYRKWLSYEPEHPVALHMLSACSGEHVPARASDAYIREYFGNFAESFDAQLQHLRYRAPECVTTAIAGALPSPAAQCDILDAGCGTGLCGPLLRPYARQLTGVDLSPDMLDKARARGVYDHLVIGELTEYMSEAYMRFDVIVSADTLVYFGRLEPALQAAATALRPDGLFAFSLEKLTDGDAQVTFRLNPHGRYSHTETYVVTALRSAGLRVRSVATESLRMEKDEPVPGLVVLAAKAAR